MKKIRLIVLAIIATAILLTGCPGPNDQEVPNGKIEIKLSEEVIAAFSDNNYIIVKVYPQGDPSNTVREAKLTKDNTTATVDLTPGNYGMKINYSADIKLGISPYSVTVVDKETKTVTVNKEDSGKLKFILDDDSKAILKSLSEGDTITVNLTSSTGSGTHKISFGSSFSGKENLVSPGTYSVEISTNVSDVTAVSLEKTVVIEKDQVTELGLTLFETGNLYVDMQSVRDSNIDVTIEIRDGENVIKTINDTGYNNLPVGKYTLSVKTSSEMVTVSLDKDEVTIRRGEYQSVKATVAMDGVVSINPSADLISAIGEGEAKVTFSKNGNIVKEYMLSAKSDRSIILPVGSYTVAIESPAEGSGIKYTVMNPNLKVTHGNTSIVDLDLEKIGYVILNVSDEGLNIIGDEVVKLVFQKGDESQEVILSKDTVNRKIELKSGFYDVLIQKNNSKIGISLDKNQIELTDNTVTIDVSVIQNGYVTINWSVDGDMGKNSFSIDLQSVEDKDIKHSFILTEDFHKSFSWVVPVGTYIASFGYVPEMLNISAEEIKAGDTITVSKDLDVKLTIKVATGGHLEGGIDNEMTGDLDFTVIKETRLDENNHPYEALAVSGENIPKEATVIWYDTSASYTEGQLEQFVGHFKPLSLLEDKLDHIEVRIYINNILRASKKIDKSVLDLGETK